MPRSSGGRRYNPITHRLICSYHKNRCVYCKKQFHHTELTREHIIPLKADWADWGDGKPNKGWANIVPACSPCNNARGSEPLSEDLVREFKAMAKKAMAYRNKVYQRWQRVRSRNIKREKQLL